MKKHFQIIGFSIILVLLSAVFYLLVFSGRRLNSTRKLDTREITSIVREESTSTWKASLIPFDREIDIDKVFSISELSGFAIAFNRLYGTKDGQTWNYVSSLTDMGFKDIFFTSSTEGFAIAYGLSKDNKNYILKTDDGGKNWKNVFSSDHISLSKLVVDSESIGWAIGMDKVRTQVEDTTNVVLMTGDNGQTWIDYSSRLNEKAKDENGRIGESLAGIIVSGTDGVSVLSTRGRIFNTPNEGRSWNLVSDLGDNSPTAFSKVGRSDDGRFWVAGGTAASDHGTWGIVGVQNSSRNFDLFKLPQYYFADAEFLSADEVIACGTWVGINRARLADDISEGVILHSADRGRNWSMIYLSDRSDALTSMSKLSQSKLIVAGKSGEMLVLEKSSRTN